MAFAIATGTANITPALTLNPYMGGYGVQTTARKAVSATPYKEPLLVRCLILWEGPYPHAIITLDLLGLPRAVHQDLRRRLVALAGWASSDIIIQATHTHNGPVVEDSLHPYISYNLSDLTAVRAYTAQLKDTVVRLVTDTLKAGTVAVTCHYTVAAASFALNRARLSTVEKDVPVLIARDSGGRRRAVVFSYGCHPVSAGWQEQFDGDWPSGACAHVENAVPGVFALALQGPSGDQDPAGIRGWGLRDTHASTLGSAVVSASARPGRALLGPLRTSYQEIRLPLDIGTSSANLQAVRSAYLSRLPNPRGQPAWYQRHAQVMASRIDSGAIETVIPNPSQVWKFQGSPLLRIALVGGELVSGYGAYLRSRFGGSNGIIVGGYAGEVTCYLPANNFFPPYVTGGSYEGGWEGDSPGIAGGSMTVYPHMAHFKAGTGGIESTLINALNAQLA